MARLGEASNIVKRRRDATRAVYAEPPKRPDVVSDGIEYEVWWYPDRSARSLLPANRPTVDSTRQTGDAFRLEALRDRRGMRQVET